MPQAHVEGVISFYTMFRGAPVGKQAYMINVAANRNGVGYGKWNHIDGWSEAVIDYIQYAEAEGLE